MAPKIYILDFYILSIGLQIGHYKDHSKQHEKRVQQEGPHITLSFWCQIWKSFFSLLTSYSQIYIDIFILYLKHTPNIDTMPLNINNSAIVVHLNQLS